MLYIQCNTYEYTNYDKHKFTIVSDMSNISLIQKKNKNNV